LTLLWSPTSDALFWFRVFFFFQAEDGIRDKLVTGVQTCALPICLLGDVTQRRVDRVLLFPEATRSTPVRNPAGRCPTFTDQPRLGPSLPPRIHSTRLTQLPRQSS